jgi:hypothetical protein
VSAVKVGLLGLGTIGAHAARLLLDHRSGVEVVGAADARTALHGEPLKEVVSANSGSSVVVAPSLIDVLQLDPEIILIATGSFMDDVTEDVLMCVKSQACVSSVCEELAFPFNKFPDEAQRIHSAAVTNKVTVLGTGVNPGFIFDSLLALATGVAWDVKQIRGRRVVDVLPFGRDIHRRLGIGYSLDAFEGGHDDGTIAGHVGFPESIQLVAERLGVELDGPVEESFESMVAESPAPTRYGELEAGLTEGFVQRAVGRVDGRDWIVLELVLHLRPQVAGMQPADTFSIEGIHPVHLTIKPGMDAVFATSAQMVNSIPAVLNSRPGLVSVKDLPANAAFIGDADKVLLR